MINIEFIYNTEIINIQCSESDKFRNACEKFCRKFIPALDISKFVFIYQGYEVQLDSEIKNKINIIDKGRNKITILATQNLKQIPKEISKELICPKCKDIDNISIKIENYKFNIFGCKYGHIINDIKINEFNEEQIRDDKNILCAVCNTKNKNESYNNLMFWCETCQKTLCILCHHNHDKNHLIINYDSKYFICKKHNNKFIKYCTKCKKDICFKCLSQEHKEHNSIDLIVPTPNPEIIDNFNLSINKLKDNVNDLINILKTVIDNIEIYYSISNRIFKETEKMNYSKLLNIKEFINFNEIIINDIKEIIQNQNLEKKFTKIISIYNKMNNINNQIDEIKENEKVINLDYSIESLVKNAVDYSNHVKNEIIFDKGKLINEKEILESNYLYKNIENICSKNYTTEQEQYFVLSLLSKILNDKGIETAVYKENQESYNDSIFQLLCCGLSQKFDLILDFGQEKNKKILDNKNEYNNLCKKLKNILSKELKINENNIIFSLAKKGSVKLSVAFITPGVYEENELKSALIDVEEVIEIHKTVLMEGCKLTRNIFDQVGNNKDPKWGIGEVRGGYDYIPPLGWYGYGLKVTGKYDNGNDNWLSYSHHPNEYAIAYYPIKDYYECTQEMKEKIHKLGVGDIMHDDLDKFNDIFEDEININSLNSEKCGKGIYLYQDVEIAEKQTSIIDIKGIRYKVLIMCRVNPKNIRIPEIFDKVWILNPNSDEIRQYRILIKIEESKHIAKDTLITFAKPIQLFKDIISTKDVSFYKSQSKRIQSIMERKKCTEQEAIVNIYTTNDYTIFNKYLNFNKYDNLKYDEKEIKSYIWCLHSILTNYSLDGITDKLSLVEDGEIVFRNTSIPFDDNIYGIGSQFYFASFTSASKKNNLCFGGSHKMKITIRNNQKKNYCYYIKNISDHTNEDEVLITAYSNFIIRKITKNENETYVVDVDCIGYVHDDNNVNGWYSENNESYVVVHAENIN